MKKKFSLLVSALLILSLALTLSLQQVVKATVPGTNTLVSVNNTGNGQGGNGDAGIYYGISMSANGKYIAFNSSASDLVANDTNGYNDVFVRDLVNATTTRVNISTAGAQANAAISIYGSRYQAISSNGRYVVFISNATDLIDGQTTPAGKVYIRDLVANTTKLVNQKSDGTIGNSTAREIGGVSNDGRFVLWKGDLETNLVSGTTNTLSEYVYLADLDTKTFTLLNPTPSTGQYFASGMSMSCDGSLMTFVTKLKLDPSDTDSVEDVYLVDIRNGLTVKGITTSSNSAYGAVNSRLSCNGDYVTFETSDTAFTSLTTSGNSHKYLYDRINNTISIVDTSTSGIIGNNSASGLAGVDDNGDVVFSSAASNLVTGVVPYSQIYLKNKLTGVTELLSRIPAGGNSNSTIIGEASISADGKSAAYGVIASPGTNLISSDTNSKTDIISSLTGL
jgi:hypothetical protein